MHNPFTRKLETFAPLDEDDRNVLDEVVRMSRIVDAGDIIIDEGDEPTKVHLVIEGIAHRYKQLSDGRRQTVAYMVPGDLCDMHGFLLKHMDHSIAAMSCCRIVEIPRGRVVELCARPLIQRALWCATLIDEAVLWEWLVNMGLRSAEKRLAHFFCEMFVRLRGAGWASATVCPLPLTQADLGETLGLSTVHINRTMQALSGRGLVKKKTKSLVIPDFEKLAAFADFNPNYLHLKGAKPVEQVATNDDFSTVHVDVARMAHSLPRQH